MIRQGSPKRHSLTVVIQKCNKTANINVKITAVHIQVNGEWHLQLQKSQKSDISQQRIDILGDVLVVSITFLWFFLQL